MHRLAILVLSGLLTAGCAQIVYLPQETDGAAASVHIEQENRSLGLNKPGYAYFLTPLFNTLYRVDPEQHDQVFGPALAAMEEVKAAGLPELVHSSVCLLQHADGEVGDLSFADPASGAGFQLGRAGECRFIDGYPEIPGVGDQARILRDFGAALEAQRSARKALRSYLYLRDWPDADSGDLIFRTADAEARIDPAERGLNLDGMPHEPGPDALARDFAASDAAFHETLALGLPELEHSYLLLTPAGTAPLGELAFSSQDGARHYLLTRPEEGVFIDGYPDRPHSISGEQRQKDFAAALEARAAVEHSLRSYAVLLADPAGGEADQLVCTGLDAALRVAIAGEGCTLDALPFAPDTATLAADFAESRSGLDAIRAAGLPELPHSYALLLEHPKGAVGEIGIQLGAASNTLLLRQAGEGVFIDGYPDRPRQIAALQIGRDFGAAQAAQAAAEKTLRSYAVLLPDPAGAAPGTLLCMSRGETLQVDVPGAGCTLDALPLEPETDTLARDILASEAALEEILAAGLPELAHSHIILLHHYMGPLGSLEFESNAGIWRHELREASQSVFIDGYPDQPHPVERSRIRRDFAPALDDLSEALKSLRSYLMLLKSPDGAASKVVYRTRGAERMLESPGESLSLDGLDLDPEPALAAADFDQARTSTNEILDAGLPELPHSYAALLEAAGGEPGVIDILEGPAQGVLLRLANEAVILDGYSSEVFLLKEERLERDFGAARAAMPPPPATYILYFDSGNARLNADSQALMPLLLEEIRKHPAADLSIDGHSDNVGHEALNTRLSLERALAVAKWIANSGVPATEVVVTGHGKSRLAVATPDNTPEPLNRRVEITIR